MSAHAEYVNAEQTGAWVAMPGEYPYEGADEPCVEHALVLSTLDDTHLVIEGTPQELSRLLHDATDILLTRVGWA